MWAMPIARRYDRLFSLRCFTSRPQRKAVVAAAAVVVPSAGVILSSPHVHGGGALVITCLHCQGQLAGNLV